MTRTALRAVIARVESKSSNLSSVFHGPQHWRCVSLLGIRLTCQTAGGDPLVAFLFGLFHDAMRENDDDDPEHGKRGAALLRVFIAEGLVSLTPTQQYYVLYACETHTTAPPTTIVPIGVLRRRPLDIVARLDNA